MPKVSIIIPIYNVAKYLDKCLESCCNQTFKDIEIICINDGSTDMSKEIVDKYAKKDNRIIAIHKKNEGVAQARLDGINISSSQMIFLLDGDDNIPIDCIKNLFCAYKKHGSNADLVLGDIHLTNDKNEFISLSTCGNFDILNGTDISDLIFNNKFKSLCAKLINKDLFKKVTIYPKDIYFGEDLIVLFQLASSANKMINSHYVVNNYVQHNDSAVHDENKAKKNSDALIRLIKYYDKVIDNIYLSSIGISFIQYETIMMCHKYIRINKGYGNERFFIKSHLKKCYNNIQAREKIKNLSKKYYYISFIIFISAKLWAYIYNTHLKN